jgi:hypothetical protein
MDLAPLRAEVTFGLNRGYLLADRIGAPTTFLVAINHHVIDQFAAEMLAAGSTTFVNWHSRGSVPPDADATYLLGASGPRFSEEIPSHGVWDGGTVTYVAMQLAFYFGFHEVVLIGVDHSFATSGQPRALVTSTGQDPNHFDPRYFGPGIRWQLPDLETSELSYRLAKDRFERAGRQILDATVGGKLTIFPKREYGDVVTWPAGTRRAGKAFCQSSAASSDPRFIPDSER